jgi:hypothetical protein
MPATQFTRRVARGDANRETPSLFIGTMLRPSPLGQCGRTGCASWANNIISAKRVNYEGV